MTQDLHVSSDGSDSEKPEEGKNYTPTVRDPQLSVGTARTESGAKPLGTPVLPDQTTLTAPPEKDPDTEKTTDPTQEEGDDTGQPPVQPTIPVAKPVTPDSTKGMRPQPTAAPSVPGADTMSPSPATTKVAVPSGVAQQPATLNPNFAPPVPPSIVPIEVDFRAQVTDRLIADLAQSLAVAQARGDPHTGSFSGIITGLRKACRLMTEGFRQVYLDVEVVVQKTIEEVTAHDWAFTAKAAQDLDLWTSALQPLFDTDEILEADMETWQAHAQHTRQVVSDRILGRC